MNTDEIIKFSCKLTGKCCIHNQVVLNPLDIFEISRYLNVPSEFLFKKKILTYIINSKDFWMDPVINLLDDNICPFLKYEEDNKYLCDIHKFRPTVCRIFPLNYNYEKNTFKFVELSQNRCKNCFETDEVTSISDFIENSELSHRINFQKDYREFINFLISSDFNLQKIKGKENLKIKFFKIQKLLYETYPNKYSEHDELPWTEIYSSIMDIVNFTN